MAQVLIDETNLTNIANAIREKSNTTDTYNVTEMSEAIRRIAGGADGLPIGVMLPYGNETPPNNWLICDGRAVSRTDYADLFAVIGTRYGSGDGSTTFNLPNKTGRISMGFGQYDGSHNFVVGTRGGELYHDYNFSHTHTTGNVTLNANQIPSHSHSFTTAGSGSHSHRVYLNGDLSFPFYGHPGWNGENVGNAAKLNCGSGSFNGYPFMTGDAGNHAHTGNCDYTGGSQAHNHGNTGSALSTTKVSAAQPFEVDNWIIKAFQNEDTNTQLLNTLYPVGKVEIFFDNLDHSNHLGFTWERTSIGKVPVGIDSSDTDFNTIGKTGGEKTHTLTANEIPEHKHAYLGYKSNSVSFNGSAQYFATAYGANLSVVTTGGYTGSYGGTQSHNNLQPYEVMAFWKRIS